MNEAGLLRATEVSAMIKSFREYLEKLKKIPGLDDEGDRNIGIGGAVHITISRDKFRKLMAHAEVHANAKLAALEKEFSEL